MLNYSNLNDVEFEYLCQDIMSQKLGTKLHRFAPGRDGGIDLADNVATKNIIVQVKHYHNSTFSALLNSLKKEVEKVKNINPNKYFICCSQKLTPENVKTIYELFDNYMDSPSNILSLSEIDSFLKEPQNIEVLKKHYKLWLDSTGILQEIGNNSVFIDCEVLLSNIEKEKNLFVQTSAYDKALNCLAQNKTLFITGNPGVGKTMTSKMLTLYFATQGYTVRYTTNSSDLTTLKNSLSRNPETKEIILVDDCFGQAYFEMKDSQNEELLALIKYVNISKNKLLILNSRVTIFQEAKERKPELVKSFENDEYKVFIIDMSAIPSIEKAKILYNQLTFSKVNKLFYEEIRKNKRYNNIINHKNYNPRLIEFVCNPYRLKGIPPSEFYKFVISNLDDPKEIWKDEYERKLSKTDRILLTTIYSLSNSFSEYEMVRECFEKRVLSEPGVDNTINQFEASLLRLTDSFINIVDINGKKRLSMVNPSVNDYLDGRMRDFSAERQLLVSRSLYVQQICRLLSQQELAEYIGETLRNKNINNLSFNSEKEKNAFVTFFVAKNSICDFEYNKNIKGFISNPTSYLMIGGKFISSVIGVFEELLKEPIYSYYKIKETLLTNNTMSELLSALDFEEALEITNLINKCFVEEDREKFIKQTQTGLTDVIDAYCNYGFDASDFKVDIAGAVQDARYEDYVDEDEAAEQIEVEIKSAVETEIEQKLEGLPSDIKIDSMVYSASNISVFGTSSVVSSYLEEDTYTEYKEKEGSSDFEIDIIFDRTIE